jgi:hypothetical protein
MAYIYIHNKVARSGKLTVLSAFANPRPSPSICAGRKWRSREGTDTHCSALSTNRNVVTTRGGQLAVIWWLKTLPSTHCTQQTHYNAHLKLVLAIVCNELIAKYNVNACCLT